METTFLTIGEASKKTGRSHSTLRRLIHSIAEKDSHPDRSAIQPSPSQVKSLKTKGENFAWTIREDVLMREFGSAPKAAKKLISDQDSEVLSMIRKEMEMKNQQIEKQWEVIHALNERLREGNILMGSLQKRLALPEAPAATDSVVEATAVKSSAEPSRPASKKAAKEPVAVGKSEKGSRKGFLGWFR